MPTTTINTDIAATSGIATAEEIRTAFTEHKQELTWLAEFLTGDELMASVCVTDARDLTESNNEDEICQERLQQWAREATVRSAVDFTRMRIAELCSTYEHGDFIGHHHPQLSPDRMELVVRESDRIRSRLDSLCRFVIILCGFEQRSFAEAAHVLGISKHAAEAAYSYALEILEVIYCQWVLESYGPAAA